MVNTQSARIRMTDENNQTRYEAGMRQPQMSAPTAPTSVVADVGAKNSPGPTGNRAPYGRRESESGGLSEAYEIGAFERFEVVETAIIQFS